MLELPPAVLFADVLETYFAGMDVIIRQNDGTIDSIAGDTLLAIFSHPEQASHDAARAAIQMRDSAAQLGAQWRTHLGVSAGSLDIGIASGAAAVGLLSISHGASRAVGPVVSMATRLRDLARDEILVAGEFAEQLHDQVFDMRALQPLRLRDGVLHPIFCMSAKYSTFPLL